MKHEAFTSELNVPNTIFSTHNSKRLEAFDAWVDFLSPIFDVEQSSDNGSEFDAFMNSYYLSGIVMAETAFTNQKFRRNKIKVAQSDMNHYLIHLYRSGGFAGTCGKEEISISSGDILIYDTNVSLQTNAGSSQTIALAVPKLMIERHCATIPAFGATKICGDSVLAKILSSHLLTVFDTLPELTLKESAHVAEGLAAVAASTLAAQFESRDYGHKTLTQALHERAIALIDRRLTDPDLSIEAICAELRVSRAHLYRSFIEFGGIAQFITDRRLTNALYELRKPTSIGRTIAEIGLGCGFSSDSHFRRLFRAAYGVSPSEIRAGEAPASQNDQLMLARWFKGLAA